MLFMVGSQPLTLLPRDAKDITNLSKMLRMGPLYSRLSSGRKKMENFFNNTILPSVGSPFFSFL